MSKANKEKLGVTPAAPAAIPEQQPSTASAILRAASAAESARVAQTHALNSLKRVERLEQALASLCSLVTEHGTPLPPILKEWLGEQTSRINDAVHKALTGKQPT